MNLPIKIARRYLFAKKSHNIINIISYVSIIGVAISTAAMVIVLSAFNGIEGLVENLYNSFDPDLKITLETGKTFFEKDIPFSSIKEIDGIEVICPTIEETALFKNNERFVTCKLKGVDPSYFELIQMDSVLVEGEAFLEENGVEYCIPGIVLQSRLGVSANPRFSNSLIAHGLKRTQKITLKNTPFNKKRVLVSGVFSTRTPYDEKYILTSLPFARNLLEYEGELTGIELGVSGKSKLKSVQKQLQELLGPSFLVKTKYEQNQLIFSATRNEKIATFVILGFVLLIAGFTVVAALTMLVLEKKKDIFTFKTIGLTRKKISNIFFYEGLLIMFFGALLGISIGLLVCVLQQKFGLVPMEDGMMVDSYPIIVKWADILMVVLTVLSIGLLTAFFPSRYLVKRLETE